jgi:carbonic anhydrase
LALLCRDVSGLFEGSQDELQHIEGIKERNVRLVELHTWSQVRSLLQKENVREAQRNKAVQVHAFVYDSNKGECVELMPVE